VRGQFFSLLALRRISASLPALPIPHIMKTLLLALFSILSLGLVTSSAQDAGALPFAVSLGGQAATYKKGEPFAKVANAVKNDAAIEVTANGNPIIINVNKTDAKGGPVPGASPAIILLQGTNKGSLAGTMDKSKLAAGNYMLSVVADGKTATILFKVE
jgi:hypothetical protein